MNLEPFVYDHLGLEAGSLGTFRIVDTSYEVIDAVVAEYLRRTWPEIQEAEQECGKSDPLYRAFRREHYFLEYVRYVHVLKEAGILQRARDLCDPEIVYLLDTITYAVKSDRASWLTYLTRANPGFFKFITDDFTFSLPDQLLNVYIVAQSQSGKTELIKLFAYESIKKGKEAVIVIEPAGDASRQIALWPECANRLIYVDLSLDLTRAPTVNPFEIYGIRPDDTSPAACHVKTVVAQQLLTGFQEVLGTGAGAELSKNMHTIIEHCLPILLDYQGATLRHLLAFMDDTRNHRLIAFAQSCHHYPDIVQFFTHSFGRKHYAITKDAIRAKLEGLFASGKFARLTCAPSTFMLETAIEERKIIIFRLAGGSVGEREGSAVGRLIVALLQGIAVRRDEQNDRIPARVIIDEFHNFTTRSMEKIITQAAKFNLYLTMVQQQIGQGVSTELRDAIRNVWTRVGGPNGPDFYGPVAKMLHVDPERIGELKRGQFIVHVTGSEPFKFSIETHLLGEDHRMTESEWEAVKADQLRRYYRTIEARVPDVPAPRVEQLPARRSKQEILPPAKKRRQVRAAIQIEEEDIF